MIKRNYILTLFIFFQSCLIFANCPDALSGHTYLGEFNNSKYFLTNNATQWQTAKNNATANGGHLASINSEAENDFLLANISDIVFIGYNDAQTEGTFKWANGESVSYNNLSGSNSSSKDFANINFWNGGWTLDNKYVSRKSIVEIPCGSSGGGTGGGTGGDCFADISGFTTIGEFGNSKYYISNTAARPVDAQGIAVSNGGYLVTISSQEENDFVRQGADGVTYIGLTDQNTEGTLEWFNGESLTYNNVNPCGFCNENSSNQDYGVIQPWNGGWSFSNFWNKRKFIMEVPCNGNGGGGGGDECSFEVTFNASNAGSALSIDEITEVSGGYQFSSLATNSTTNYKAFNYLRDKNNGSQVSTTTQQLTFNSSIDEGYWDRENNVLYTTSLNTNNSFGNNTIVTLKKYDASGNQLWSSTFDMLVPGFQLIGARVRLATDNHLIIASSNGPNSYIVAAKTDLNGNLIWKKAIELGADAGTEIDYSENNSGGFHLSYRNGGPFLGNVNSQGNLQWVNGGSIGDPASVEVVYVGKSGDGERYYTKFYSLNIFKGGIGATNATTGQSVWELSPGEAQANGSNNYQGRVTKGIPTNDGGLVVFYSYRLGTFSSGFSSTVYLHERYDANGNLIWSRETPAKYFKYLDGKHLAAQDGGFILIDEVDGSSNWEMVRMTSEGFFEPDCGGGNNSNLPDLTVSNLSNLSNSGTQGEVIYFNVNLNNIGTAAATGSYNVNTYISTDNTFSSDDVLAGEIVTGDTPIGTTANVPSAITVPNLSNGNYYLIVVADALGQITESNENNNTVSTSFQITSGGGGGCSTSIPTFTSLGEFNGSAYYISNYISRAPNGHYTSNQNGGHLAVINSQAENDFIANQITELVYIGINDKDNEGSLEWFNGEPVNYTNFDVCSFCTGNSSNMDFVVMHSWNGGWSWSNFYNQRKFIMEIPCGANVNAPTINTLIALPSNEVEEEKLILEKVFPNPAMNNLYTAFYSPVDQEVEIQIIDARGVMVKQQLLNLHKGDNTVEISIADLQGGMYSIYTPQMNGRTATKRFIKVVD